MTDSKRRNSRHRRGGHHDDSLGQGQDDDMTGGYSSYRQSIHGGSSLLLAISTRPSGNENESLEWIRWFPGYDFIERQEHHRRDHHSCCLRVDYHYHHIITIPSFVFPGNKQSNTT
jgi:hypothetical protein